MTESPQFYRRHDLDPRRSPWVSLLVGLVVGLLLGLLIGWVLWPVSWTNAAPGDLSAEAQAGYVSAVADAYVSARNLPARTLAEQRLRAFGDEAAQAQAIEAARLWYSENQPDEWRVRTSNLNELASALDLAPLMDAATAEEQATDEAAQALVTAAADATAAANSATADGAVSGEADVDVTAVADRGEPVDTGEPGWISWLFVTLTALLLIAGGLYMLRRLYAIGRQQATVDEPDAAYDDWSDDQVDARNDLAGVRVTGEADGRATPQPRNRTVEQEPEAGVYGVHDGFAGDAEDYGFDEEIDDIPTAGTAPISLAADREPAAPAVVPHADDSDAAFTTEEHDEETTTAEGLTVTPGEPVPMPHHPDAGSAVQNRAQPAESGRLLDRFTAHYQFGVPDYDEAFNIRGNDGSTIIGACGMGVNIKDGILQDNPENVVALDVWLFDKVNPSKPVTETIVLVPGSATNRDRPDGAQTLVARQGAHTRLEGSHLILDCVVEAVTLSDHADSPGVFRDVRVAMAVSRR